MIIDSHFHGYKPKSKTCWAEDRMKEMGDCGISFVEIGIDIEDADDMIRVMTEFPLCLGVAVGQHPKLIGDSTDVDSVLEKVAGAVDRYKEQVLAVKTGLDYYRVSAEGAYEKQRAFLRRMLEFAGSRDLPAVLHIRSDGERPKAAHEDVLTVLRDVNYSGKLVLHCFSGDAEIAEAYLRLPARVYFGVGGSITYPDRELLAAAVKEIPESRILLETDAPYIKPFLPDGTRVKGNNNTPLNLPVIMERLAEVRGVSSERIREVTVRNANEFYGLNK